MREDRTWIEEVPCPYCGSACEVTITRSNGTLNANAAPLCCGISALAMEQEALQQVRADQRGTVEVRVSVPRFDFSFAFECGR